MDKYYLQQNAGGLWNLVRVSCIFYKDDLGDILLNNEVLTRTAGLLNIVEIFVIFFCHTKCCVDGAWYRCSYFNTLYGTFLKRKVS